MKVLPGDDIDVISLWTEAVRRGLVAAILLWMHNGLGYIYK
jgi:hypothetical protein